MSEQTKTIYLELPAEFEWAKVFQPDMGWNNKWADRGGAYSVDAIISAESYKALQEAGSLKEGKIWDEEDQKWIAGSVKELRKAERIKVKFERPHDAPYSYGGPPQVAHADTTLWDVEEDGLIGNGSSGYVIVCIYQPSSSDKRGTRLESLQIIDLVPYESTSEPKVGMKDRSGGVPSKPQKEETPQDLDDEIPF